MNILSGTILLVLLINLGTISCLNVLFSLPCWGGHFGTMSSLLVPVCEVHNCTVIEWAKLCERKLKSFHQRVKFDVIKRHGLEDEYSFVGRFDFLFNYCPVMMEQMEYTYNELTNILKENFERAKESADDNSLRFDIMITDHIMAGTLIVAEKFNLPVVIQTPGIPGGVEHMQDKYPVPLTELIVFKWVYKDCFAWVENQRASDGLPKLDSQGDFLPMEYTDRFPLMIPTSESITAEPHPTAEYIFFGGMRNESNFKKLDQDLETWIDKKETDIIYISLGTHVDLDTQSFKSFYQNIEEQSKYRVIWSLSLGLEKTAKEAGLYGKLSDQIFLSDYLPQYTLLGHSKVKIFVSHMGLGSMVDLIKREIPAIAVPQFGDQFANAIIMENLSVSKTLPKFDFENLKQAVEVVMADYESFQANLKKISAEFEKYEKPELINNFLTEIAGRKQTTIKYKLDYEVNSPRFLLIWKAITIFGLAFLFCVGLAVVCVIRNFCIGDFAAKPKTQ
ncbi:UDP-glycosyltransferase UGT4-like [Convolutriloba macropyga]|uniref:UDP-glycosyltransferase UGT4-like n=1 Tax=Convolutriloba macropyga TaxID=536237 RepID=UPI003F5243D4